MNALVIVKRQRFMAILKRLASFDSSHGFTVLHMYLMLCIIDIIRYL